MQDHPAPTSDSVTAGLLNRDWTAADLSGGNENVRQQASSFPKFCPAAWRAASGRPCC